MSDIDRINQNNERGRRGKDGRTGVTKFRPKYTEWLNHPSEKRITTLQTRTDCNDGGCEACYDVTPVSSTQTNVYLTTNFVFAGLQLNFDLTPTITNVAATDAIPSDFIVQIGNNNIIIVYTAATTEIEALTGEHILTITHNNGDLVLDSGIVTSLAEDINFPITTIAGLCGGGGECESGLSCHWYDTWYEIQADCGSGIDPDCQANANADSDNHQHCNYNQCNIHNCCFHGHGGHGNEGIMQFPGGHPMK